MCDCYRDGIAIVADELHFVVMTSPKIVEIRQNDTSLNGVTMSGSSGGMSIYSNGTVTINNCNFYDNEHEIALRLISSRANTTITDSVFRENRYGVMIHGSRYVALHGNEFTKHSHIALQVAQTLNTVNISDNRFAGNGGSVELFLSSKSDATILRNTFENGTDENAACVEIHPYGCEVAIEGNDFSGMMGSVLYILESYGYHNTYTIKGNTMTNISETPLVIKNSYFSQMWIYENVFQSNNVVDKSAAIYISSSLSGTIAQNDFKENNGNTIIELQRTQPSDVGDIEIKSNTFYKNVASLATIVTEDAFPVLHYNLFSNPQTRYDLHVTVTVEDVGFMNATYNWWGIATSEGVAGRIWDESDESGISHVQAEPFPTTPGISCTGVANCSDRGECVRPGMCECHSGWTGSRCSQFSCTGVANCSGRGECVHPDTCECRSGWTGTRCSQFSCSDLYGCHGKGECVGPNTCRCDDGWLPPDCAHPDGSQLSSSTATVSSTVDPNDSNDAASVYHNSALNSLPVATLLAFCVLTA